MKNLITLAAILLITLVATAQNRIFHNSESIKTELKELEIQHQNGEIDWEFNEAKEGKTAYYSLYIKSKNLMIQHSITGNATTPESDRGCFATTLLIADDNKEEMHNHIAYLNKNYYKTDEKNWYTTIQGEVITVEWGYDTENQVNFFLYRLNSLK